MSEALLSGLTAQAGAPAKNPSPAQGSGTPSSTEAADFPMLFGSMLLQGDDGTELPASISLQPPGTALLVNGAQGPGAQADASTDTVGETGNLLPPGLPQLAFSALIAVDDGEQAAAVALQGDGQALRAGQPVVTQNLSQALRQALSRQAVNRAEAPVVQGANPLLLTNPGLSPENFNLELGNLSQAVADQLAREADIELAQANKPAGHASGSSNTQSGSSGLGILNALNSQLGSMGARPEAGGASSVSVPPQHPQWGQQLGDRMQWMIGQNLQRADIRLNPPELGSLEVRIQLNKDHQTSISFSSPHAQVREALDAAMPRLREMMNDAGLNLANVDVSQHSFGDSQAQHAHDEHSGGGLARNGGEEVDAANGIDTSNTTVRTIQTDGLVDFYA